MTNALTERENERDRLIELARRYVDSVGRGCRSSPPSSWDPSREETSTSRATSTSSSSPKTCPSARRTVGSALAADAPGGVQPAGFTPEEFGQAVRRGNPLAREAVTNGVVLHGADFLRGTMSFAAASTRRP
jgi:hypothetical protein